jgi:putative endonuclease
MNEQGIVYILRSLKTDKFYVGSTNNLTRRLEEHNRGHSTYTRDTGPYELVFSQGYPSLTVARRIEQWLKAQKSAKFLERIIEEGEIKKKVS